MSFWFRQYYSSCKTGNMDSALSIWFLLLWLGGDSCNLVGSFLADQLPLQVKSDSKCFYTYYTYKYCAFIRQSEGLSWFCYSLNLRPNLKPSMSSTSVDNKCHSSLFSILTFVSPLDIHCGLLRLGRLANAVYVLVLQTKEQKSKKWVEHHVS